MAQNDDRPPTLASLRLGTKSRRRRTGWEAELFLFEDLPLDPAPPVFTPGSPPPELAQTPPESLQQEERSVNGRSREAPVATVTPVPENTFSPHVRVPVADLEPRVWTVRALVTDIRNSVETGYTDVRIAGEISNLRPAPSGHLYFTLKDGEAQLPVVLFRRQAQLLRFRPKDGDEIQARGRISIYESRGQLQLIAEHLELRGAGALQLAFEQLKARLLAEGLFDPARKRPLPTFPRCIGIITSVSGAVIRDIVTVARRRHARLNLLIYPATMQGPSCPTTVAAGIRWFNQHPERTDLILIARGGGSFEDLAGFNDESLARAIAASTLPIVSAIGHETDFTIADFVADLRAPTPSAAAEIITAAQHQIESRLESLALRSRRAIRFQLLEARQRYARLSAESVLARLRDAVSRRDQRLDDLRQRLEAASNRRLRAQHTRLATLENRLHRQDLRVRLAAAHRRLDADRASLSQALQKVFATRTARLVALESRLHRQDLRIRLVADQRRLEVAQEALTRAAKQTTAIRGNRLSALETRLRPQDLRARLATSQHTLAAAHAHLLRAAATLFISRRTRLAHAHSRLEALSPLAVLNRGYALVYSSEGTLLTESAQTAPGQTIRARLATGTLTAQVLETQEP